MIQIGKGPRKSIEVEKGVEGLGHVLGQPRRVELRVAQDAVDVRVLQLQELLDPMHQLHVRFSPNLAEDRGALDRLVGDAIELSEQV